jgi:hypothetical protein
MVSYPKVRIFQQEKQEMLRCEAKKTKSRGRDYTGDGFGAAKTCAPRQAECEAVSGQNEAAAKHEIEGDKDCIPYDVYPSCGI